MSRTCTSPARGARHSLILYRTRRSSALVASISTTVLRRLRTPTRPRRGGRHDLGGVGVIPALDCEAGFLELIARLLETSLRCAVGIEAIPRLPRLGYPAMYVWGRRPDAHDVMAVADAMASAAVPGRQLTTPPPESCTCAHPDHSPVGRRLPLPTCGEWADAVGGAAGPESQSVELRDLTRYRKVKPA